jgi:hypothetical protein
LLETLISLGIMVGITIGLSVLFRNMAQGTNADAAFRTRYDDAVTLVARLQRDASSALAVFVPASDVLGNANADGHEVDFYARDSQNHPLFWAYRYDATAGTITRYTYATPGAAATAGLAITSMTGLTATAIAASSLVSDPLVAAPLAGYTPTDVSLDVGYAGIEAGNGLTAVRIQNAAFDRTVRLLPGTGPTGFTVSGTYAPTPGATDAAGNTSAQESLCSKPAGFDYTDGSTSPPTDYYNVPPTVCAAATPQPQQYGAYSCSAAAGAVLSTNPNFSPPVQVVNYGPVLLTEYCNAQTLTPTGNEPHQLVVETDCSKPSGYDRWDTTTIPTTEYVNVTAACSGGTTTYKTLFDWQYRSTTPGCAWNQSGGTSQTCTLTATLILSRDNGFYWSPLVCVYDGSFDPSVGSYTYTADGAQQSACPSIDPTQLPVLYHNAADPRA